MGLLGDVSTDPGLFGQSIFNEQEMKMRNNSAMDGAFQRGNAWISSLSAWIATSRELAGTLPRTGLPDHVAPRRANWPAGPITGSEVRSVLIGFDPGSTCA